MQYSYKPLMHKLIELEMTKIQLAQKAAISSNVLARIGKNEPVSMDSLAKIAIALDCQIGDIVEVVINTKE